MHADESTIEKRDGGKKKGTAMTIQEAQEKLQGYEKATFALNHATGLKVLLMAPPIAPKVGRRSWGQHLWVSSPRMGL